MSAKKSRLLKNRYLLKDEIGTGGMASVYAALDTQLGRDVAVKLFASREDDDVLRRQEAEVSVLSGLNHHGLVTLLDAGVERDRREPPRFFIVMELVTGADLRQTLRSGTLTSRDIGLIGYDIAEALQYVHNRGVVHRDIKPSNILFVDYFDDSDRARAKLTDFGIAHRGVERATPGATTTTGTAAYLSPEQVLRADVGAASDIYSLGLVLLECFTRRLEFDGEPAESAMARIHRDPVLPPSLNPKWASALASMTARNPADRPTAKDLVRVMRELVIDDMTATPPAKPTTEPEPPEAPNPFDDLTAMAARIMSAPIAIMALRPDGDAWLKREYGIDIEAMGRAKGRYGSANLYQASWIEESASADPRVLADPAIAAQIGLGFYASAPMVTSDGIDFAIVCVLDFEARQITRDEQVALNDIAERAMDEFETRLSHFLAERAETN